MAFNFQRPNLPYEGESLQNDKRYQLLEAQGKPPTAQMFDADFNCLTDNDRKLDAALAGISIGIIPGAGNPDNANRLPVTDGETNISWVLISDQYVEDESISASKMIPGTLTALQMMDGTIPASKLAPNSVPTIKIVDFNVTANKLAPNSVPTDKIVDLNVTTDKLANLNVTAEKLAPNSVPTDKIVDGNVTLIKLAQDVVDFIDRLVPIGAIMEFPGSSGIPSGWLECNGQVVSRVTYATLFARIGVTYGSGDGSTTFALPDRRGRVSVGIGSDNSTGGRITSATASNINLGGTFGAETHQLTVAELAAHTHTITHYGPNAPESPAVTPSSINANGEVTSSTGGDQPHNNVQPSIFMRYYIRAL